MTATYEEDSKVIEQRLKTLERENSELKLENKEAREEAKEVLVIINDLAKDLVEFKSKVYVYIGLAATVSALLIETVLSQIIKIG